jgi:REP element-mobilizing transposase RayT
MPDHVHLLLTPLRDLDGNLYSLIEILQGIKSASAHSLNRSLGRSGPVWQEESFDHVLRSVRIPADADQHFWVIAITIPA